MLMRPSPGLAGSITSALAMVMGRVMGLPVLVSHWIKSLLRHRKGCGSTWRPGCRATSRSCELARPVRASVLNCMHCASLRHPAAARQTTGARCGRPGRRCCRGHCRCRCPRHDSESRGRPQTFLEKIRVGHAPFAFAGHTIHTLESVQSHGNSFGNTPVDRRACCRKDADNHRDPGPSPVDVVSQPVTLDMRPRSRPARRRDARAPSRLAQFAPRNRKPPFCIVVGDKMVGILGEHAKPTGCPDQTLSMSKPSGGVAAGTDAATPANHSHAVNGLRVAFTCGPVVPGT